MPRNPYAARLVKKRKHKPGNLQDLLRVLWQALLEAEAVLNAAGPDDWEMTLKAAHCISQCGGQYAKLLEVGEFEARLKALENGYQGRNGQ
jgi:hypothetical protein